MCCIIITGQCARGTQGQRRGRSSLSCEGPHRMTEPNSQLLPSPPSSPVKLRSQGFWWCTAGGSWMESQLRCTEPILCGVAGLRAEPHGNCSEASPGGDPPTSASASCKPCPTWLNQPFSSPAQLPRTEPRALSRGVEMQPIPPLPPAILPR